LIDFGLLVNKSTKNVMYSVQPK